MEWDRGLPWYRPTRVLHVVPGGEYGFREGSAKWPDWYPDSLPPVVDIGLGCPTGVKFGTLAKGWPEKYRKAFFICDWTFGRLLAVHMKEKGASYTADNPLKSYTYPKDVEAGGDVENFLSGKGLPLTDVEFGKDGAMFLTVGGRGTQAGLYRVTFTGVVAAEPALKPSATGWFTKKDAAPRKEFLSQVEKIEQAQQKPGLVSLQSVLLMREDPFASRYMANRLIAEPPERLPNFYLLANANRADAPFFAKHSLYRERLRLLLVLLARNESWMTAKRIESLAATYFFTEARKEKGSSAFDWIKAYEQVSNAAAFSVQPAILTILAKFPLSELPDDLKLIKLRILELSFARQGRPTDEWVQRGLEKMMAQYPASGENAQKLNRELCQLLVWLSNPTFGDETAQSESKETGIGPVPNPGANVHPSRKGSAFHAEHGQQIIERTLALMDAAPSQEEQIYYALCLRWAHGWTPPQRERYFRWFHEKAVRFTGGNSFAKFVDRIRADAVSRIPETEKGALSGWLGAMASAEPQKSKPQEVKPRPFVKAWTLTDLEPALDALKGRQPDLAKGKQLYAEAQCAQCHLFGNGGGNVGPDLTAVAQRFGRKDILEAILDPNKAVSDQYAMITLSVRKFGGGGEEQVSGLVQEETSATITLLTDPLSGRTANYYTNVITKREKANVSIMPPALIDTLTAEEVADLLAYLGAK
jgi:putative heme-binding domain-containing protein